MHQMHSDLVSQFENCFEFASFVYIIDVWLSACYVFLLPRQMCLFTYRQTTFL